MSQLNKIPTPCLPSRWWDGPVAQAVTGATLVAAHFEWGRHPVAAGGERLERVPFPCRHSQPHPNPHN